MSSSPGGPVVGLIDYRAGNIQSLSNALGSSGAEVQLVKTPATIPSMTHLVLPGVGAFGYCADRLRASGLLPAIEQWALRDRRPMLGICVGMQLLAESSDELGTQAGLGWVRGHVTRLHSDDPGIRIPHVGWNNVMFQADFGDYHRGSSCDVYFDHSFAFTDIDEAYVLASCMHGQSFCAALRRDNIVGVQFHPEKSQAHGLRFLRGFLGT